MGDTLIRTTPDDPRAQRLLQSLDAEYAQRYGEFRSTTASNGPVSYTHLTLPTIYSV